MLLGCSVYTGDLVDPTSNCGNSRVDEGETCDREIRPGAPGACPAECDDDDPCAPMVRLGTGCDVECVAMPLPPSAEPDGCCPQGAHPENDADCGECGDGVVDPSAGETCDPPGSCRTPEECVTTALCTVAVFSGQAADCTADCAFEPITECLDDDACCPPGCSFETDADCPEACGDGVVDASAGETCDPGDPNASCDERCEDDDPCTLDEVTGSAKRCNVRCSHDPITSAHDDDACCPPGIDNTEDSDCTAMCTPTGDDAADPDATCAAPSGAGDEPTQPDQTSDVDDDEPPQPDQTSDVDVDDEPPQPDQTSDVDVDDDDDVPSDVPAPVQQCREVLTSSGDPASADCAECVCDHCADLMRGCYLEGDAQRIAGCSAIMQCKQRVGCVGDDCYCGDSRNCLLPNGPCADEIDEASGRRTPLSICVIDPGCANYWASAYTECLEQNCTGPCR